MRRALDVEPPVVHLLDVLKVRREPSVVADPSLCKGVLDQKTRLAGFDVVVKDEHKKSYVNHCTYKMFRR